MPPLADLFGLCVLPETYTLASGSGCFSIVRIAGSTVDTEHVSVVGGFWLIFHIFPREGGPRILRSIHVQFGVLPWEVYRKLRIYWEWLQEFSVLLVCFVSRWSSSGSCLLGNTGGMDQKDSIVVVMAVASARLVLLVSLFALCFFCRCQALMPRIMAGMDQVDGCALFDSGSGTYKVGFTGDSAPRAVFLPCRQAKDAPHHGPYAPEGQSTVVLQWHVLGWVCWFRSSR